MADVVSKVCDLCREDEAEAVQIVLPEGTLHVDLCSEHRAPLEQMREAAPATLFLPKGQSRRRQRVVVNDAAI